VTAERGAEGAAVEAGLEELASAHAGVEVLTRGEYLNRLDVAARKQAVAAYPLLGLIVVFSAIAAVNALVVAVSERSRDLELLRLIGATRRQLTRMIRFEVLIMVSFATVVGALTAAPGAIAFTYGVTGSLVPTIPAWLWLGLPLTSALLAFVAIALTPRDALKGRAVGWGGADPASDSLLPGPYDCRGSGRRFPGRPSVVVEIGRR
jgi:putative ABC transport system permease protein